MNNKYEFNGKEKQEKEFSDGSGLEWIPLVKKKNDKDGNLLTIFVVKQRLFWVVGILLFVYGTYALTIWGNHSSAPLILDFTYPLRFLICGTQTGSPESHLLKLISVCFYPICLIVFLTTPVRRLYHISK